MSQLLTLVRHAKSSWKEQGQADFDRPLNDRGRRDGPVMARRLATRQCVPDLMLISTARRARETADFLLDSFKLAPDQFRLMDELYLAEPGKLLEVISNTPEQTQHLMIVAHNPGLEALSEWLANRSLPPMPTLGIRHFQCPSFSQFKPAPTSQEIPNSGQTDTLISDTHKSINVRAVAMLFDDYPKNDPD